MRLRSGEELRARSTAVSSGALRARHQPVGAGKDVSRNSSPTPRPTPASSTTAPRSARPAVAWALFKLQTGTDILYIPYQGAAPAITDLIAGRMHMIIDAPGVLSRMCATTGSTRSRSRAPRAARISRRPDHGGERLPRIPDDVLDRRGCAGGDAGSDRQPAQRGDQRRAPLERDESAGWPSSRSSRSRARPKDFGAFIASEAQEWASGSPLGRDQGGVQDSRLDPRAEDHTSNQRSRKVLREKGAPVLVV